jgi:hypothetical protein
LLPGIERFLRCVSLRHREPIEKLYNRVALAGAG